ncbi:MAG: Transcriptional regulator, PadR family [uncultured Chloroflexia bacterium]|uniref:Transcriptional regulator, PadR family n=1 Tax=uncultured Chloroflexia bacterium TaxID=1672391 RepID=A0A6J4HIK0_9CHLR|nr:MAG: Transcriptional regulator, PadR family [uncultured Chloroflexia bacterium]
MFRKRWRDEGGWGGPGREDRMHRSHGGDRRGWHEHGPQHHPYGEKHPFGHPPRGHQHGFGPRMWKWQTRRNFFGPKGPFGPGGPFGPKGPFGPGGDDPGFPGGKRFFGRGDLKFALLELLEERPMHGYEMMKALQDRSGGRYNASPGSVYPTLQMLEDRGFVTSDTADGKKVYTITEEGKAFLHEHRSHEQRGPHRHRHEREAEKADMAAIMHEIREIGPLFAQALKHAHNDPSKRQRLRALITRIRGELAEIVAPTDYV